MAVKLADAIVALSADVESLKSDLNKAQSATAGTTGEMGKSTTRMGSVMQGVFQGIGQGLLGLAADALRGTFGYLKESLSAASDMGETTSKIGVLFGESSDKLMAWAETADTSLGQSKQQALDAAATFATFGKSAGLSGDELVDFSTNFVGLASDLASFNNTTPEEAINAIGAALRGESEPLRKYGILLDDASMRQKALELGIISSTKEALTPQQKVLAAQALIFEQTGAAQGDFARTSAGAANQQRILSAQMENMKATIGTTLLPVWTELITLLNHVVQAVLPPLSAFIMNSVVPAMTRLGAIVGAVVPMIQEWFTRLTTSTGPLGEGVGRLQEQFRATFESIWRIVQPISELIISILRVALIAAINVLSAGFHRLDEVVSIVLNQIKLMADSLYAQWQNVVSLVRALMDGDWAAAWAAAKRIVAETILFLLGTWNNLLAMATQVWGLIADAILGTLTDLGIDTSAWLSTLRIAWAAAWTGMALSYQTVENALVAGWETLRVWATETIPLAFTTLKDDAATKWQAISDSVTSHLTPITDALGDLKTWLDTTIQDAFTSFKEFLSRLVFRNPFESMSGWLDSLIENVKWLIDHLPDVGDGNEAKSKTGTRTGRIADNVRAVLQAPAPLSLAGVVSGGQGGVTINISMSVAKVANEIDEYAMAYRVADVVRRSMR